MSVSWIGREIVDLEDGQALADYALIITFIAIVCVIAAAALGVAIAGSFESILPAF